MRTYEEYERILQLWERGFNKLAISQITDIPRATVRDCIDKFETLADLEQYRTQHPSIRETNVNTATWSPSYRKAYAYLLGLYLGDGHISQVRNSHRLRISLDQRQPNILKRCVETVQLIMPDKRVSINKTPSECVVVSCYTNRWIDLLPQHGKGEKHTRRIELTDWQKAIWQEYSLEFFRGLYHSDGARIEPVIYNRVYARYQFTQVSTDIQRLFAETCDLLGLHYTFWGRNFTIAKRKDVAFLDEHIGPKS